MGGTCSAYGEGKRRVQDFGVESLRKREHLLDTGVDGSIILRRIFRKWDMGYGSMDWIEQDKDREGCRALVNAVMNIQVS
jgi:hypothetical protein